MTGSADKNIVNRANCAKTFGVSVKTISAWVRRGCPYEQKGGKGTEWLFDTPKVFRWHLENVEGPAEAPAEADEPKSTPANYEQARARKMQAEAALAEIDLELKAGSVALIDVVLDAVSSEYATVRTRLGSLPGILAPRIDASRAHELQPVIAEAVDDILRELSADERLAEDGPDAIARGGGDEDGPPRNTEAGSAPDAKGMG